MRDEILKLADKIESSANRAQNTVWITSSNQFRYKIVKELRRIVAAEDARLRVAQTDARCACDGEPDGE